MKNIEGYVCFAERLDLALAPFSVKNGVLILEADPEPGYFSKNGFPENLAHASDHHLYILTKHPVTCFQDWVIQHSFTVRDELKINLHISPGQLTFMNKQHNCLRIRTREVESIKPFLKDLEKLDVEFVKHSKHVRPYNSIVHFKKHAELIPLENSIYADVNDKNRHFIKIQKSIEFEEFENIVEKIKNNCGFNMFNTAYATLPKRNEVMNFVAIYSKHCDEKRLPEFKSYIDKHI
ncbi:MAG: hypothetical protein DRJ09_01235 [Bacteroidetes bacterium]|nr:MAG: hypothetical protein DRJ09_01235 [Bacteroidota bacterium]